MGALSFFKETIFADRYAGRKGFFQSLDPRIKAVTVLLFIMQTLVSRNILILFCLYVFCLLLVCSSRIKPGFFLKRTWFFIPLFSFFIALPAIFSVFTPGQAIFSFSISGFPVIITRQGAGAAGMFVMRVIVSVSFAVLLSITTRHFELLKVMRLAGVPQIFVMVAGMCYRYVYLFVDILENMYRAIKSRVGRSLQDKKGRDIVSGNIAFLWLRSCQLNEDVYKAMLSRGYRGEPVIFDDFRVRARDWFWLAGAVVLFLSVLYVTYVLKL